MDRMESAFKVFTENWTFDDRQRLQLESRVHPTTNTCSNLVKEYIQSFRHSLLAKPAGSDTLLHMVVRRLHHVLRESPDTDADLDTIFEWIVSKEPLAKAIFKTMPYPTLRAAISRLKGSNSGALRGLLRAIPQLRDMDEALLATEEDIRHADNASGLHLVTIQDLKTIVARDADLSQIQHPMRPDEDVSYSRHPIPAIQMPLLDENREDVFCIRGSDQSFIQHLWTTADPLRGLDWNNVLLVGAFVLDRLYCTQSRYEHRLELRLYGLDAAGATAKLREIENRWRLNAIADGRGSTTVVRTDSQIVMVAEISNGLDLLIPLRVWPSPTAALLDISLDPCALGFNGANVVMMPRCARAIETGYSILTSRLVLDQTVLNSPMLKQRQILEWSREGFGIRVLAAYTKFLKDDSLDPPDLRDAPDWAFDNPRQCPADLYSSLKLYRRVDGPSEPGAKTIRRVTNQGQDLANRWLGLSTPLQLPFDPATIRSGTPDTTYTRRLRSLTTDWSAAQALDRLHEEDVDDGSWDSYMRIAVCGHVDLQWFFEVLPFENFVRCAEIQRQLNTFANPADYTSWQAEQLWPQRGVLGGGQTIVNPHIHLTAAADHAFDFFIKSVVNDRTQGQHWGGYRDYLSGRVRLSRADSDLDRSLRRLSLPLLVTNDIETELGPRASLSSICNPAAHLQGSSYSGGIPPVPENSSELGNMRYFHIDTLWQGFDAEEDETCDILRLLSYLTALTQTYTSCMDLQLIKTLRYALCLRRVLQIRDGIDGRRQEAKLFKSWIMALPKSSKRTSLTAVEIGDYDSPAGDVDLNYLYPVPDELFWGPEFEDGGKDRARRVKRTKTDDDLTRWLREEAFASA